jgi:hypothetical protein
MTNYKNMKIVRSREKYWGQVTAKRLMGFSIRQPNILSKRIIEYQIEIIGYFIQSAENLGLSRPFENGVSGCLLTCHGQRRAGLCGKSGGKIPI